MSTWIVEHGMVPLRVPEVFPPVDFSMQAHVFFGDTWHHPYISTCFYGKRFYFLVSLLFMECKLHSGNLSLKPWRRVMQVTCNLVLKAKTAAVPKGAPCCMIPSSNHTDSFT